MTTAIRGLSILLLNAACDLARGGDLWSPRVWDHATRLHEQHGAALIAALTSEDVAPERREAGKRLAAALLVREV